MEDDLLSEFVTETNESLEVVDAELVRFEADPKNRATLDNIFRLVHTIKGTCGFLGLPRLEAVAHAGETLLGRFRDGVLDVTPDAVSLVLESIDQIKTLLAHLESEQSEPNGDDGPLIKRLEAAAGGEAIARSPAPSAPSQATETVPEPEPAPEPDPAPEAGTDASEDASSEEGQTAGDDGARWDADLNRPLRPGEVSLADLEAAFLAAETEDPVASEPAETQAPPTAPAAGVSAGDPAKDAAAPGADGAAPAAIGPQTIRVNVDVLENMMTMVSELVLTRNQLLQTMRSVEDSEFKVPLQRLSNITADLQDSVMKTRMQPISNAWKKLPRIVRDCAKDLGKKINLNMEGGDTELDRQVLELIKDPLTHMVRNSCDHGIEGLENRMMAGKSEAGELTLRAFHEGGHIIIQIADDGAGLNTDRIRRKVIEKGLLSEVEANETPDQQIHRYIFHPGFSTAAKVTNMSGRGVGMDVVRTNIEQMGGAIDLHSVEGRGTTFTIKIPLTLAIVSALIVEAGGSRFAIPQLAVIELVRVGPERENTVETINGARVLRLRDTLLPLMDLTEILELGGAGPAPCEAETEAEAGTKTDAATATDGAFVVVMQVAGHRFGVIVHDVFDTEEIVVKPLAGLLRNISVLSGNTILGDGSVIMILDPNGLSQYAAAGQDSVDADKSSQTAAFNSAKPEDVTAMLVFQAGSEDVRAAPLSLITRLEEIAVADIERANGRAVVQYRGKLMTLLTIGGMPPAGGSEGEKRPCLVFVDGDNQAGILVDDIIDIVEEPLRIDVLQNQSGVAGTAVLRGKVTEIIDVSHFLTQAVPTWFEQGQPMDPEAKTKRVLLIDDNAFFRQIMTPLITSAGYEVTQVESAAEAWALHGQGEDYDLIISDIDMPEVDGVTLAKQFKTDPRWGDIPRFALSGLPADRLPPDARTAFDKLVRKTDRAAVVRALETSLPVKGEAA